MKEIIDKLNLKIIVLEYSSFMICVSFSCTFASEWRSPELLLIRT